jgi:hypothetical protein
VFGEIPRGAALQLASLMPENGVIFSDEIEADFLDFKLRHRCRHHGRGPTR